MSRKRIVGHGELLKALTRTPRITDKFFRIASVYLSHTRPPTITAYPSARTMAKMCNCDVTTVHRAKRWLVTNDVIRTNPGGGRGNTTVVDFSPLQEKVTSACSPQVPPSEGCANEPTNGGAGATVKDKDIRVKERLLDHSTVARTTVNGGQAMQHKGPKKYPFKEGRTKKAGLEPAIDALPDDFLDSKVYKTSEDSTDRADQPDFNQVMPLALTAFRMGTIHASDWGSISVWWQGLWGGAPTDGQLQSIQKYLNERSGR